ncbi:hypothetical protein FRC09_011890 [Ceratobasidium sp. 395]|nr:hypothetical protein FRC09_011890 [Ceratobasidium sp. 395]
MALQQLAYLNDFLFTLMTRTTRKSAQSADNDGTNASTPEDDAPDNASNASFDDASTNLAPSGGPLTDKETNMILTATVTHNPYGQPRGKKGDAWVAVQADVNESEATSRVFQVDVIKRKVQACLAMHKGETPARTRFSNGESNIYHSQIDRIRGQIEEAKAKKLEETGAQTARAERQERDGQLARQAALETFTRAARPAQSPDHSETSPPPGASPGSASPSPSDHLATALNDANEAEDTRHQLLLDALQQNSEQLTTLNQSIETMAQAQIESNQLLSSFVAQAVQEQQQPDRTRRRSPTPEPSPRKRRATRAHPNSPL